jgi:hypothetical protein
LGLSFYHLREQKEAEQALTNAITTVEKRLDESIEPRTRLLARTTQLICYALIPDRKEQAPAIYQKVMELYDDVQRNIWVFSQFRMRDVDRSKFKSDLNEFAKEQQIETARYYPGDSGVRRADEPKGDPLFGATADYAFGSSSLRPAPQNLT